MNLTEIKNSTFTDLSQFMPESELLVAESDRFDWFRARHSYEDGHYFSEDNTFLSHKLKMAAYEKYWQQNKNPGYTVVDLEGSY